MASLTKMSVRTYNPSVRVGNWNEDIQLEEDTLKDFLERRERGELHIQKSQNILSAMKNKKELSVSRDGNVHFGDVVMFKCLGAIDRTVTRWGESPRSDSSLSMNVSQTRTAINEACEVSASRDNDPCVRNTFIITSVDGTPAGEPLRFDQPFHIKSATEDLFLQSDRASFLHCAKFSRNQDVKLVPDVSSRTKWQILYADPRLRMEYSGICVQANEKVVINHMTTNNDLAVEEDRHPRTPFGLEYEISANTYLDSHKAERDINHWLIVMNQPGNEVYPPAMREQDKQPEPCSQVINTVVNGSV